MTPPSPAKIRRFLANNAVWLVVSLALYLAAFLLINERTPKDVALGVALLLAYVWAAMRYLLQKP